MSQSNTINPYEVIGQQIPTGLNTVIAALPASPTVDDLVNEVYNFVQPIYYPNATAQQTIEIKSVAYNAINSYRNSLVLSGSANYSVNQIPFLQMLIGPGMTANTAPDSFTDRIEDIEDNIGTSNITVFEQTPLFLSTTIGRNASQYWLAQIANPQSLWAAFFSTTPGANYLNSLLYNVAAMNGALSGYGASPLGLIEPTTNVVSTTMVSSLIGALTVTAGKVIFNWIPRITKPMTLSSERIVGLNSVRNNPTTGPDVNVTAACLFNSRFLCGSVNNCGGTVADRMLICAGGDSNHGTCLHVYGWICSTL